LGLGEAEKKMEKSKLGRFCLRYVGSQNGREKSMIVLIKKFRGTYQGNELMPERL